jgi:hypothetical protein
MAPTWPHRDADKWIAEDRIDQNPLQAARRYALQAAALFDTFIASQYGKFTYWSLRSQQLDAGITLLFPVPISSLLRSFHQRRIQRKRVAPESMPVCQGGSIQYAASFCPSLEKKQVRGLRKCLSSDDNQVHHFLCKYSLKTYHRTIRFGRHHFYECRQL